MPDPSLLTGREFTFVGVLLFGIMSLSYAFLTERIMVGATVRRREAEQRADFERRANEIMADLTAERAENFALRKENRELLITARNSADAARVLSDKVQALSGAQS